MATIERFEDLECWQAARQLRRFIYVLTRQRNFSQDLALVGQIRRAAVSVSSNIAEGFDRGGNREFIQFLSQAKGSCAEVKDQLYAALDESYIEQHEFDSAYELADQTARKTGGVMTYLRRSEMAGHKFDRSDAAGAPPMNAKPKTQNAKP